MIQLQAVCKNMTSFNYSCQAWNDYLMQLISKALQLARDTDKIQNIYVFREADAEKIIQMLDMISAISEHAFLVEVRYVRLN